MWSSAIVLVRQPAQSIILHPRYGSNPVTVIPSKCLQNLISIDDNNLIDIQSRMAFDFSQTTVTASLGSIRILELRVRRRVSFRNLFVEQRFDILDIISGRFLRQVDEQQMQPQVLGIDGFIKSARVVRRRLRSFTVSLLNQFFLAWVNLPNF